MKLNKAFLVNLGFCLLIACAVFLFSEKGLLRELELSGLDLSFKLRGEIPAHPKLIIVEITDADIAKVGRWPWPRAWHAAVTRALEELGAKYVLFDILFAEPSQEEDDALLEEALKLKQAVYLPFAFQSVPPDIKNAILPLSRFSAHMKGMGAVNIFVDSDGNVRRIPLVFESKGQIYPHMALALAMDYAGLEFKEIKPRYILLSGAQGETKIPLIAKDTMLINWLGKWQHTFKHYDFLDVLAAYKDLREGKKPEAGIVLADFKDSVCIVALTAIGLYDIKAIPIQAEFPGIGITATAISNILNKNFLSSAPAPVNILILYLLALLPAFLIRGEKPFRESVIVAVIAAAYFIASLVLFRRGFYLNFSIPLAGLLASYLTVEIYNFMRVAIEKKKFFKMAVTDGLTGLYNIRYFKMVLETEIALAKHDLEKKFCVVMSDVDHFKHFNDTYGHQVGDLVLKEVANALKDAVRAADLVARYGGEEMIVLLRGVGIKDALVIAEKLRKSIEDRKVKDGDKTYNVTASLGVSVFKPQDDVDGLIKRADDGLYKSKEGGRNCVSSVDAEPQAAAASGPSLPEPSSGQQNPPSQNLPSQSPPAQNPPPQA